MFNVAKYWILVAAKDYVLQGIAADFAIPTQTPSQKFRPILRRQATVQYDIHLPARHVTWRKTLKFFHADRVEKRKGGEPMIWHMDSDDDMEILTEDNDSTGKRIVVRKRIKDGDGNQVFYFKNGDMRHFPPMPPVPPVPPVPHMRMMKMQHSGQIINLNDPNIISFKKKEMSGDREKIEIIRKKSEAPEDMTFGFNFDNELAPPPPPAPEMIRELENDNQKMKIMEKEIKVDGKKGKEIKVEIENKENK